MSVSRYRKNTLSRFLRNGVALAAGGVVAQVALLFIEVMIARNLGATVYGIFATTYAFTVLATFIVDFGSTWWTIQEGSRRPAELPSLLGNSLVLKTVTFVVLFFVVVIAIFAAPVPPDVRLFVAIFGLYALGIATQDSLSAVYAARQDMHVNAVFQALSPVAILAVYLIVTANGLSLVDIAVAYVAGAAAVAVVWLIWTSRRMEIRGDIRSSIQLAFDSYHYGLTGILRQIFYRTDVVMIAFIAGVAEAGLYAAAMKFLDLFYKVPVLVGRVVLPALFAGSHNQIAEKFENLVSGYARMLVSIGAGAALMTFLAAEKLVALVFGSEYSSSVFVLQILSLAMALKCMMTVSEGVLSSLDRHMERWSSLGFAVILNVILNLFLIPHLGGVGAAIATIASGVALVVLYVVRGFGRSRIVDAATWFAIPLILAIVIGGVISTLGLSAPLAVAIATALFLGLLFMTRIFRIGELMELRDSILLNVDRQAFRSQDHNSPPTS